MLARAFCNVFKAMVAKQSNSPTEKSNIFTIEAECRWLLLHADKENDF